MTRLNGVLEIATNAALLGMCGYISVTIYRSSLSNGLPTDSRAANQLQPPAASLALVRGKAGPALPAVSLALEGRVPTCGFGVVITINLKSVVGIQTVRRLP